MGLLPDVWKENRVEEQLVLKKETPPTVKTTEVKKPVSEPKKVKIKRVTIEWEDITRPNSTYDIDGVTTTSTKGDRYFTIDIRSARAYYGKRLYFPVNNIHCIAEEDMEILAE